MLTKVNITIYNKYVASHLEAYQLTAISGIGQFAAQWQGAKAAQKLQVGLQAADTATIYLFYAIDKLAAYLEPAVFDALTSKTGYWTLRPEDVIVKGIVTDAINSTFSIADLRKKYTNALAITSVDFMDMGSVRLNHWQIGAK